MWNPRKTLVLHNSRETLARLLNRQIRHLCTTYDAKWINFLSQVCYVCMVPGVSLKMIQDDRIWQSYMQCGMMLWHLLTSFFALFLFCLKALFLFFSMATLHNAQTKIAIVYMREQTCDTRYDSNICTTMIWYVCYGKYGSVMCTSNVAGNTQMASLDRQVTQK